MLSEKRNSMLHGVLLIALFSCAAFYIGDMEFIKKLSFSPMIVGIILGMLYANSLRNNLPETWVPGIQFCSKRILRIGDDICNSIGLLLFANSGRTCGGRLAYLQYLQPVSRRIQSSGSRNYQ